MKTCILDGNIILNKDILHDMLSVQLDFPDWYGKNLDALYDCLGDLREETEILIFNEEMLRDHLEKYAGALLRTLEDAAEENDKFRWRMV